MSDKPISWLRACRRVRLIVHELVLIIINIAGAGAACGICWAVWILILATVEKGK